MDSIPSAAAELSWQQTRGRKILLVDDERLNLTILRKMLEPEGYVLAEAGSAEAALDQYASFSPDLVLFDVLLPGMNGFDACRELHRLYRDQAAPVMFITAKQDSDAIVEGFNAGGVDYVLKPFRQKEVLARIHTHLQIRLLVAHQQTLVAQLSRANAAKTRFLGMAAHDLRNPLATIRGLTEFMLDGTVGPLTPDQAELVELIHHTSQGMVTLVNDLLDLATIESGEFKLDSAPTRLADVVAQAVTLTAMASTRKRTRIEFARGHDAPLIRVDAAKALQVIDNLLSNAVKYSPPGSTIRVALEVDAGTRSQILRVRDQGPGIPEQERDRLFTDFGRLSNRPTGGEQSIGLGLAICRKIVESHRGTIEAENHPDGGCEFRVTLPNFIT
ncbi:MAG: response regulator [Opitutus sp.]|nr:response regulator [Opitutus sp.]MCS6274159.1 response regulator [Opitutus sp.]MCS6278933.1 response regulator [Opitutus sp.]MCS6298683.1 response regulator [Opitutus sp.]